MDSKKYILSIDQGTSSTKCLVFDEKGIAVSKGSEALYTHYFNTGFVEQEPELIYQNVLASIKKSLQQFEQKGCDKKSISAIGISNQRETFMLWDKDGTPLHNAIVWQCKRSISICEALKKQGFEDVVNRKTGLFIDPYFSATKLIWLLQHNDKIKEAIKNGEAFFGTVDTWLLFRLTNGKQYATDYTNASRTMLFNLHTQQWDVELIEKFGLTGINLPQVKSSSIFFGETTIEGLLESPVPITALIGDSHAAAFGEGCFETGTAKATLGTGCSILMNIGDKPVQSYNGMVTTVCWSIEGRIDYALEGVIVSCGSTIEWMKNEMHLFNSSNETESLATSVTDNGGVYLIPAFSGLGSPHWDMERRASITGMSFSTTKNHLVRAALESIPFQIKDVIVAMEKDAAVILKELHVDGGITNNNFVVQLLADLLNKNVATIGIVDVSALGAALLAGLHVGVYESIEAIKNLCTSKALHIPINTSTAVEYYKGWQYHIAKGN